ncbi:MAG: transglutaminase domain-containing protein [Bacteroidales bacterium]|nr:transglutaminase domain-containing protein [Bacteroidales bacterium]
MKYFNLLLIFITLSFSTLSAQNSRTSASTKSDAATPYNQAAWEQLRSRKMPSQELQWLTDSINRYHNARDLNAKTLGEALLFLYAYMPQSDLCDYDFAFFKQQAAIALEGRKTFTWGSKIPDDIFRHFVLVYRVNNENLDTARAYIYHQLKERVRGLSMYEAALEVNHWCHEHVDYQPSDVRTSAPLATLRTSHGRCGEESTLTVTAMRAVGIPARQCYTPRWAHCDDNHAWVEVWVDGKWQYLGACEPDPELNMGWFSVPASRTMMVHTNVFGKYEGPEEVNKQTRYYSCINVLSNYAETVTATVKVVDIKGKPVSDATVRFQLYNYAEYYTLAERKTGPDGTATLVTGKGDLLIWVSKGDEFNYAKMDCRAQPTVTITLPRTAPSAAAFQPMTGGMPDGYVEELDMFPPVGGTSIRTATPERIALNDQRKASEDAMRAAYRKTFPTPEALAASNFHNEYFTDDELYDIIRRSEGNFKEIMAFLNMYPQKEDGIFLREFIESLADKDLRDATADILNAHIVNHNNYRDIPKDVFIKGMLAPRISNEMLRHTTASLYKESYDAVKLNPTISTLVKYTADNIVLDPECNYYNCPISPDGVIWHKCADAHSLGIFFVALCRTHGIPAFMDNSNGDLYAWENNEWHNVQLPQLRKPVVSENQTKKYGASANAMSTLVLHNPNNYAYYPQYTLQRWENGQYVSYDFENDPRVAKSHIVLNLPAGKYCLSTGNRYGNGDVLSRLEFFDLPAGKYAEKNITLRPLSERPGEYGHIDADQTYVNGKSLQQWMSQSGSKRVILCLVTPGTEPVNHLAKEIAAKQAEYEKWNGPLLFVANNGQWKPEPGQPKNLSLYTDNYDTLRETILKGLTNEHQGANPVCVVIDQNGTITLFSEGYHIGLGDLLFNNAVK